MNTIWAPALQFHCTTCGADKGEPCITRDGHRVDIPHAPRLRAWERHAEQVPSGIVQCVTCGLMVSGDVVGGECNRCRVVRELTAERYQLSPRHQPKAGPDGPHERS